MYTFKRKNKKRKTKKRKTKKQKGGNSQKGGSKKLMCSPAANSKSVQKNSTCFTPDVLLKIKQEFNKDFPQNPIVTNEVREIWQQLHDRLTSTKCKGKNESCWLSIIDDKNLAEQIKEHIFAPEQPSEWKTNPDEWLSNFDIFNVIKQYEEVDEYKDFKATSPTSIDFDSMRKGTKTCVSEELCKFSLTHWMKKGKKRFGIVFNLDKHTGPGSHWVTLFVDNTNKFMFFFDSAGNGLPKEVKTLMDKIENQSKQLGIELKRYDNDRHSHQNGNTECGMYSLYFMITMLTGKIPSKSDYTMSIEERIDLFLKKKIPDKLVFDYRDLYFNEEL